MPNNKNVPNLFDPDFIDINGYMINGGGEIHTSGDVVINGIRIGEDLYQVGPYIVNSKGDILEIK